MRQRWALFLIEVQEFDRRVRDAVDAVEEGEWWEFAGFAGPRLDRITGWGKVALIGDASHPLSGEQFPVLMENYYSSIF